MVCELGLEAVVYGFMLMEPIKATWLEDVSLRRSGLLVRVLGFRQTAIIGSTQSWDSCT